MERYEMPAKKPSPLDDLRSKNSSLVQDINSIRLSIELAKDKEAIGKCYKAVSKITDEINPLVDLAKQDLKTANNLRFLSSKTFQKRKKTRQMGFLK